MPLKPIEQWIRFYKDVYIKAAKAIDQIGLDGLERALNQIEHLDWTDCEDINATLGKGAAAPANIRNKCKSKLNSGVGL